MIGGEDAEDNFLMKGFLWPLRTILRNAIEMMRPDDLSKDNKVEAYLTQMLRKSGSIYMETS
jgi:hypothetical protein